MSLPGCIVYVQPEETKRRVDAYLRSQVELLFLDSAAAVESAVARLDPVVLILDLCANDALSLLRRLCARYPDSRIVAMGLPRSDPALEAETLGVHAVAAPDVDGRALQSVFRTALDHVRLLRANRAEAAGAMPAAGTAVPAVPRGTTHLPLHHFARAFRHFEDVGSVFESIADGVASCAGVNRAGVFALDADRAVYRLRAGIKCFEDVYNLTVARGDPLVQWLERNAHLVSRSRLALVEDTGDRGRLIQALDTLGAEVLVPLHGRRSLIGWVFVGHRATGAPFSEADLEDLSLLAENVSLTIENALLYHEVAVQKTLAETVLHAIPIGIVAVDGDNQVRWFNHAAGHILGVAADDALGAPAGRLGTVLADLLSRGLKGEIPEEPVEWVHPGTEGSYSTVIRSLTCGDECLGVVAITADRTQEQALRRKEEQVERATFWTELAAAMSHEVRNPLVAVNTFAQLLPERYNDPEFRDRFSELATSEIKRLDHMLDQLNTFANPPELSFEPLHVHALVAEAVQRLADTHPEVSVRAEIDEDLPRVHGDRHALVGALVHLLANATEAAERADVKPAITIEAEPVVRKGAGRVAITVRDEGPGIEEALTEKVFSPFCSTKARGIGLGLPIVKRTAMDHGGEVRVESSADGTVVTLDIPTAAPKQEAGA
jgi:nitrogen-specific signal transduction histidine kinase